VADLNKDIADFDVKLIIPCKLMPHVIMRPLQNAPFCPISALGSYFNPQNTQCIRACPVGPEDRTGWLKYSPALNLNKIEHFSKVSIIWFS
jgi:hypothetical protein